MALKVERLPSGWLRVTCPWCRFPFNLRRSEYLVRVKNSDGGVVTCSHWCRVEHRSWRRTQTSATVSGLEV